MRAGLVPAEGLASNQLIGVRLVSLLGGGLDVTLDPLLVWQVENLDALLSGDDQPVQLWREENAVDLGVAVHGCAPLTLVDVPDHDLSVTGSGGEVVGVIDDVQGGNLGGVSLEGEEKGHVGVVPDLDGLVPRGGDAKGWLLGLVESNTGDGISVRVLLDGMLALRTGVPNLDLLVETSSDDLSVIRGKVDREDISLVTDELADGSSVGHVPESDSSVP